MRFPHIHESDNNLFLSLQALIEERSITRAALRMNISQPTMSRVFDRLQQMFQDELLVRTVNGYQPTRRALRAHAELERLLPRIEEMLRGAEFNPAEAVDSFRIAATDHAAVVLLPGLMKSIAQTAPGIQINVSAWDDHVFQKVESNALDLALWVNEAPQPLRSEPLFQEEFVCLLRAGHPLTKGRLTIKRYLGQKHAAISVTGGRQGLIEQSLDRIGRRRNVQLNVPYYGSVGAIIESTDLIATLPKRVAERVAAVSKTMIVPAPREFESFTYIQVWHPRYDSDPAHRWLRQLISTVSLR